MSDGQCTPAKTLDIPTNKLSKANIMPVEILKNDNVAETAKSKDVCPEGKDG